MIQPDHGEADYEKLWDKAQWQLQLVCDFMAGSGDAVGSFEQIAEAKARIAAEAIGKSPPQWALVLGEPLQPNPSEVKVMYSLPEETECPETISVCPHPVQDPLPKPKEEDHDVEHVSEENVETARQCVADLGLRTSNFLWIPVSADGNTYGGFALSNVDHYEDNRVLEIMPQFGVHMGYLYAWELTRLHRFNDLIEAISKALDLRDRYTALHSETVARLARDVARVMGRRDLNDVYIAGLLHDIGKIGIPEEILNKPGRLDDREMAVMHTHAEHGWDILRSVRGFEQIGRYVRQHHEHRDGSGYPTGTRDVDEVSQILSVCDAYHALTSNRVYRKADSDPTVACAKLIRESDHPEYGDRRSARISWAILRAIAYNELDLDSPPAWDSPDASEVVIGRASRAIDIRTGTFTLEHLRDFLNRSYRREDPFSLVMVGAAGIKEALARIEQCPGFMQFCSELNAAVGKDGEMGFYDGSLLAVLPGSDTRDVAPVIERMKQRMKDFRVTRSEGPATKRRVFARYVRERRRDRDLCLDDIDLRFSLVHKHARRDFTPDRDSGDVEGHVNDMCTEAHDQLQRILRNKDDSINQLPDLKPEGSMICSVVCFFADDEQQNIERLVDVLQLRDWFPGEPHLTLRGRFWVRRLGDTCSKLRKMAGMHSAFTVKVEEHYIDDDHPYVGLRMAPSPDDLAALIDGIKERTDEHTRLDLTCPPASQPHITLAVDLPRSELARADDTMRNGTQELDGQTIQACVKDMSFTITEFRLSRLCGDYWCGVEDFPLGPARV